MSSEENFLIIVKAKELAVHTFKLTSNCARKHYTERVSEQTKAIVICDEILFYIELSMNLGLISNGSADYWSKMVSDIKYLTLGWRKKDKERICD